MPLNRTVGEGVGEGVGDGGGVGTGVSGGVVDTDGVGVGVGVYGDVTSTTMPLTIRSPHPSGKSTCLEIPALSLFDKLFKSACIMFCVFSTESINCSNVDLATVTASSAYVWSSVVINALRFARSSVTVLYNDILSVADSCRALSTLVFKFVTALAINDKT